MSLFQIIRTVRDEKNNNQARLLAMANQEKYFRQKYTEQIGKEI